MRPSEAMEQLEDTFHSNRGSLSGRVRLAAADLVLRFILPEALLRFRQRYPQVRVETCTTYSPLMVAQVLEDNVDFAVGDTGDSVPATVRAEVIKSCDRLLVVAKGDPLLRLPQPVTAQQLRHRDWIVLPQHSLSHRKLDALVGPLLHCHGGRELGSDEDLHRLGSRHRRDARAVPRPARSPPATNAAPGPRIRPQPLRHRAPQDGKALSPAALALIDVISPGLAQRLAIR